MKPHIHKETIIAWANGAQIQWYRPAIDSWVDISIREVPCWDLFEEKYGAEAEAAEVDRINAVAGEKWVQANQCTDCHGTGVDGDVGDQGQLIDVPCGWCNGSGQREGPKT